MQWILMWMIYFSASSSSVCSELQLKKRKNVLFLVSDDMRPEINAYLGSDFPSPIHPRMVTPNLDQLAGKSLLLKKAYVQQAVCSPSRTSLLTGRRPDTTHVYDLYHYFRDVGGNFTTLPEYFKDNGYVSLGMGKVFHPGHASGHDDPPSWSGPYYHAPNYGHWQTFNASWIAVDNDTLQTYPLPDTQLRDQAIKNLKKIKTQQSSGNDERPFFLALGFHKPHLPFVFPAKFLDMYPAEDIRLPDNSYAPVDMPSVAWYDYEGLRSYHDVKKVHAPGTINSSLPLSLIKELRRAYYSALTYTDSLIGEVLQVLEELGLDNDTIVSFWGDHGWQLGEHGEWCKQTNFELATHAPMMIHIPGLTDKGIAVEQLTEYVDLFPTLVDAAGLPALELCPEDSTKVKLCREGNSLLPLIKSATNDNDSVRKVWKQRVFSQYPRKNNKIMGYTMRTGRYRYTEWVGFKDRPHYQPVWDHVYGVELYDHGIDPEENYNRASQAGYRLIKAGLSKLLKKGWRHA